MPEFTKLLGRQIKLVLNKDLSGLVSQLAHDSAHSVFFCNVHMLMLAQEEKLLAQAMDTADWVFADGVPIAWLQSRISGEKASVVRGYEFMLAVCEHATRTGERVGLMGSTETVMGKLAENLTLRFPGLSLDYKYCPPFVPGDLESGDEELRAIRESGVRWLFVGLGCPKQEKWIARYSRQLDCHMLGVGAAFDWLSGLTPMPPEWMERSGLGWLYRLLCNPRKMWHRYLKFNTKFMYGALKILYFRRPDITP